MAHSYNHVRALWDGKVLGSIPIEPIFRLISKNKKNTPIMVSSFCGVPTRPCCWWWKKIHNGFVLLWCSHRVHCLRWKKIHNGFVYQWCSQVSIADGERKIMIGNCDRGIKLLIASALKLTLASKNLNAQHPSVCRIFALRLLFLHS